MGFTFWNEWQKIIDLFHDINFFFFYVPVLKSAFPSDLYNSCDHTSGENLYKNPIGINIKQNNHICGTATEEPLIKPLLWEKQSVDECPQEESPRGILAEI